MQRKKHKRRKKVTSNLRYLQKTWLWSFLSEGAGVLRYVLLLLAKVWSHMKYKVSGLTHLCFQLPDRWQFPVRYFSSNYSGIWEKSESDWGKDVWFQHGVVDALLFNKWPESSSPFPQYTSVNLSSCIPLKSKNRVFRWLIQLKSLPTPTEPLECNP